MIFKFAFHQLSVRWAAKSLGTGRITHFPVASGLFVVEGKAKTLELCTPQVQTDVCGFKHVA